MDTQNNQILFEHQIKNLEEWTAQGGLNAINLVSESAKEVFNRIWGLATRNLECFAREKFSQNCKLLIIDIDAITPYEMRDSHLISKNPYIFIEGALICSEIFKQQDIYFVIRGNNSELYEILTRTLEEFRNSLELRNKGTFEQKNVKIICETQNLFRNENLLISLCLENAPSPMKFTPKGTKLPKAVILDAETIVRLPGLMQAGISANLKEFPNNFLLTIAGDVNSPGIYEVQQSMEFSDVFYRKARGLIDRKPLRSVKIGGILSPFMHTDEAMKINLDLETYKANCSDFQTPTLIFISEETSIIESLFESLDYFVRGFCGFCAFGREKSKIFNAELLKIKQNSSTDWTNLIEMAGELAEYGYCSFPAPIKKLIESALSIN